MRRPAAFLLSAAALLLLAPSLARAQQDALPGGADRCESRLQRVTTDARARTVLVFGVIGMGSGAVVRPDGLVVTNAHVVAAARYALVQWADGRSLLARRQGIDYERDLAVLAPAEPLRDPVPCFELRTSRPPLGEYVVALGFPGGLSTTPEPTCTFGRVVPAPSDAPAQVSGVLNYEGAIHHDAPIFSGNSGGPLVDLDGRLVGINGAVALEQAVSMTIPAELIADRVARLTGDVVRLPGGQMLDPARTPLLRQFYDLLDPMARRLPERVADAARQAAALEGPLQRLPLPTGRPASDALADLARRSSRQGPLDRAFSGPWRGVVLELPAEVSARGPFARVHATVVDASFVVCKASLLGAVERVRVVGGGEAVRVAVSAEDDLALLRLSAPRTGGVSPDATLRPVGSIVHAVGPDGLLASGIVSADPRRTSAALAAGIQGGGVPQVVEQALDLLERGAERLRLEQVLEVVRQVRRSIELQRAFAAGTPPRAYALVLAIDAPLAPSAVGAPVFDREGELVGVSVGIAHFGTTYVVPISRVRRAFAAHLPGPPVPERVGNARLH